MCGTVASEKQEKLRSDDDASLLEHPKISTRLDRCVGGKKDFQLESDTLDSCCFYVIRENNVIA